MIAILFAILQMQVNGEFSIEHRISSKYCNRYSYKPVVSGMIIYKCL